MTTRRMTTAQALIRFLANQYVERDGIRHRFFAGVWGIFGHGNVAGVGQALQETGALRYLLARNEQAMVHAAAAYAKARNRLATFACTSSIGPGATNMVTGAAAATINRLPVLLLPGDVFATRRTAPVLQQLESPWSQDLSVNDALRPVSRYWDRIDRPEQLVPAALEALRILTSPSETGAVTLALPQDVQAEAWGFPEAFLAERVWRIPRPRPDDEALETAAALIRSARRPLIVAGGGVLYSEAAEALRKLVEATGIPVGETQAGKGALPSDHPGSLGAIGVTGTSAANAVARRADLVIGLGTRYSDFTTGSRTAFQDPGVRFVNVNVAGMDACKLGGLPVVADVRAALEALLPRLEGYRVEAGYEEEIARLRVAWAEEVTRLTSPTEGPLPTQAQVIGVVNEVAGADGIVVSAAGSLPGDLHKLWRVHRPGGYHLEYGYSCMGYEVAGGLGVKLAHPDREVYVMVGDGSWLMMSSEIATCVQEGVRLTVVLIDNGGFASIGGLSESLGQGGYGTRYRRRDARGELEGEPVAVDFVANAASLGAVASEARTLQEVRGALEEARASDRTTVIVVRTDPDARVGSYDSWWDVPVAEVSAIPSVVEARRAYDEALHRERWLV
ncbi:MAG TPA: 3D-(3,5/4)-trihydroxycyclohexane-1,2-dione acylhydrolase (decyclizing) [Actinomycetota bacterium]|nr:3D-(3,5/4)-trihydroxycyclohexane-1,2-dione acylhydrolase (decyclizing) [Actinomycetota bacterium]